jgi:hypothetical protein
MLEDSKEYRKYAEECRRLATEICSAQGRYTLLHMADRWEELAVKFEGGVRQSTGNVTSLQEWSRLRSRR